MTITSQDIKLLKSQSLANDNTGGGQMTGVEIVSGLVNNVFDDPSSLARVEGEVAIAKAFIAVLSDNDNTYLGAHVIITNPPTDPAVNAVIFSTENWSDTRPDIVNHIQGYSVGFNESQWVLWGTHVKGLEVIKVFSAVNGTSLTALSPIKTFSIGELIMFKGEANQYVRVLEIMSRAIEIYTNGATIYYADVVYCRISAPLTTDFVGTYPSTGYAHDAPAKVYRTITVDSNRYYGVKKLIADGLSGVTTLNIGSPYVNIVPSASVETSIINAQALPFALHYVRIGTALEQGTLSLSGHVAPDNASVVNFAHSIKPRTLTLSIDGISYADDGAGGIVLGTGGAGSYSALIQYAEGVITLKKAIAWSSVVNYAFVPATTVKSLADSLEIEVTEGNRATSWIKTLHPKPSKGSVTIDFMVQGRWYSAYDDHNGHLVGGYATGTVDYDTGSTVITMGSLPDAGTSIIYNWAIPADFQTHGGTFQPLPPSFAGTLVNKAFDRSTFTISWSGGSAACSADGVITGGATGTLLANGVFKFTPTVIAAKGTVFTLNYQNKTANHIDVFTVSAGPYNVVTLTLQTGNIQPGSLSMEYLVTVENPLSYLTNISIVPHAQPAHLRTVTDDGAGGLMTDGNLIAGAIIDYVTGIVSFKATVYLPSFGYDTVPTSGGANAKPVYVIVTPEEIFSANTAVVATYSLAATPIATVDEFFIQDDLVFYLTNVNASVVVPGSVRFGFRGKTYYDKKGLIYTDWSRVYNTGTLAGAIDYAARKITLTLWEATGSNEIDLSGMIVTGGEFGTQHCYFRTQIAPLSPGQFEIQATTINGDTISATVDNAGVIESTWIHGKVNAVTGICSLKFGKSVLDSTLYAPLKLGSWYNADDIVNGYIFLPLMIDPGSVKYNTVAINYLPLNKEILGIDSATLPQDGRMSIVRKGDNVVVHSTLTTTLPNPAVAGATYDMGRVNLAYAKVFDALGVAVDTAKYTPNLAAGTLTMANPLVLTAYTQPLVCEHRIENFRKVSDVQFNGIITLQKPLANLFHAANTYVSSALLIGNLRSRILLIFDQLAWTGVWSDTQIGSSATGTFNIIDYPLVLTNRGAMQDRYYFIMTSTTAFNCYSEIKGFVGNGTTTVDFAPNNPATSVPLFTLNHLGWGSGWSVGNVLRINTAGANYPIDIIRTVLQSDPAVFTDNFKIEIRGDVN